MLPWQQYQNLLRLYLTKLRTKIAFQKQLLRVVVAILDAFHFDISQSSTPVAPVIQENSTEESEVQKSEEIDEEEALEEMVEKGLEDDEKEEEKTDEENGSTLAMESIVSDI